MDLRLNDRNKVIVQAQRVRLESVNGLHNLGDMLARTTARTLTVTEVCGEIPGRTAVVDKIENG